MIKTECRKPLCLSTQRASDELVFIQEIMANNHLLSVHEKDILFLALKRLSEYQKLIALLLKTAEFAEEGTENENLCNY